MSKQTEKPRKEPRETSDEVFEFLKLYDKDGNLVYQGKGYPEAKVKKKVGSALPPVPFKVGRSNAQT